MHCQGPVLRNSLNVSHSDKPLKQNNNSMRSNTIYVNDDVLKPMIHNIFYL